MGTTGRGWVAALLATALLIGAGGVRAQSATTDTTSRSAMADTMSLADLRPGGFAARLTSKHDSAFHYAAFLPPGYRRSAPAPLLILMDPRGRAMEPMTRTRRIASRVGWIVLSSYETASDDSTAPNAAAVNAMLADAQAMLNIDGKRIYFAGFSGLARASWQFAEAVTAGAAGIIAAGAAGPPDALWKLSHREAPKYDVVLAAGFEDFNFEEVRYEYARLADLGAAVRFEPFAGPHEWPTEDVMSSAIAWLDARTALRAQGRRPLIAAESLYTADTLRARQLEVERRTGEAADAWTRTAVAWRGMVDITATTRRAAELAKDTAVVSWRQTRTGLDAVYDEWNAAMFATFGELHDAWRPDAKWLRKQLELDSLTRWAATSTDSVRAAWATRRINLIFSQLARYQPDALLADRRSRGALAALALARQLNPSVSAALCAREAKAYDQMKDKTRADAARACASGTPLPTPPPNKP